MIALTVGQAASLRSLLDRNRNAAVEVELDQSFPREQLVVTFVHPDGRASFVVKCDADARSSKYADEPARVPPA